MLFFFSDERMTNKQNVMPFVITEKRVLLYSDFSNLR